MDALRAEAEELRDQLIARTEAELAHIFGPAFLRSMRIDRTFHLGAPDRTFLRQIFAKHLGIWIEHKKPLLPVASLFQGFPPVHRRSLLVVVVCDARAFFLGQLALHLQ